MLFLKSSSAGPMIEKDIRRWIQICAPERSNYPIAENMLWLLIRYPEFRNVFYFRLGAYLSIPQRLLLVLTKLLYTPISTLKFFTCVAGPGLYVRYGLGTIVGAREIGENCWISQGVAIGYKDGNGGLPTIGNNVYIGAGSKILGPVNIGDNVIVGANSVVIKDVPANCTIAGIPARIIKKDGAKISNAFSPS